MSKEFHVSRFTLHALTLGPVQTNCYIVGDDESKTAVVIDPGWSAERILAVLNPHHWQVKYILLTHAHFDHIGAAADLAEATRAPLAVHPLELPLLRANGGATAFGLPMRQCPEPDILLEPGQVIEVGALRFEVLFVPGHTVGHVAFYEKQAKAVFSGDVLFQSGIGRTDFPGGNYNTLMHSIKLVLFTLPDDTTVYSGHGPATTIGEEKRDNPFVADV
jgi:glyoxylase-like metal-dependent hydrolase (beta-lactamase superfamily II)